MIARHQMVALIVACAAFMQQTDSTIVATALPQMAVSFHASPVRLSVSITAYLLGLTVFIPVSGWMADRFGGSMVFRVAIGVFTLGSILCAASTTIPMLIGARFLQGMGGAMMQPVGRLLVLRASKKSEFVGAMAWIQVPAQLGPVLGPVIGGFITTYASWRWIFFINVPIGVLGILLAIRFIPNEVTEERRPLDRLGFLLSGGSLVALMYGLDQLGHNEVDWVQAVGGLAVALALIVASVRHARRAPHPLIQLSLLRIRTFAVNFWGGSLFRYGVDALPFLLPLLFQTVLGMSALDSGLLTFSSAVGSLFMRFLVKPVLRRWGFRMVLVVNGLISVATMLACLAFTSATPAILIYAVLTAGGFFRALQFTALNTIAYADVSPAQMSASTSFAAMVQQLGNAVGIAIAAIVLHAELAARGATQLNRTDVDGAFIVMALITLASLPWSLALPRDAGAEFSGHKARG